MEFSNFISFRTSFRDLGIDKKKSSEATFLTCLNGKLVRSRARYQSVVRLLHHMPVYELLRRTLGLGSTHRVWRVLY